MSEGIGQFIPIMKMPKLITFALPSVETIESDSSSEIKKLERLLPAARSLLTENGVLGGTYVIECTTRLIWSDLAVEEQMGNIMRTCIWWQLPLVYTGAN